MHPELARHRDALERLGRRFRVRRPELFGSAASGRDRPGVSDPDLLVEIEPVPPGEYADAYLGLLEALEDLFGRPIDLVTPEGIKNPYFRRSVDETKGARLCKREARKYLYDIQYDIQQVGAMIAQSSAGRSFGDYLGDAMLRSAVERRFEIIGEALTQLTRLDTALAARISEDRRISAFRHVLRHGCATVNDRRVRGVVETKLAVLRRQVDRLLDES
jgi:predicted nucleotidyltransferase/uncharacterized protein with HEPN domain